MDTERNSYTVGAHAFFVATVPNACCELISYMRNFTIFGINEKRPSD